MAGRTIVVELPATCECKHSGVEIDQASANGHCPLCLLADVAELIELRDELQLRLQSIIEYCQTGDGEDHRRQGTNGLVRIGRIIAIAEGEQ